MGETVWGAFGGEVVRALGAVGGLHCGGCGTAIGVELGKRVAGSAVVVRCWARTWASITDWVAPLDPIGYIACAASPSSAIAPLTVQVGSGSILTIG